MILMKLVLFCFFPTVMHNRSVLFHNFTVSWRTFKSTQWIRKSLISINLINRVCMFLKYFSACDIVSNVNMLQIQNPSKTFSPA